MIQVTRTGTVFSGSADDLEDWNKQFERQHCIRLPQLLEPQLLRLFQHQIVKAEFYERVHEHVVPPPVDLCMKSNKTAASLSFLMNDPFLFKLIQQITRCPRIGCFSGTVYRLVPGLHYDSWHDDLNDNNLVSMSINVSTDIYSGGVLQIRDRNSQKILHEAANTGFGDGIIFRISPDLLHRVSKIEGVVPRTAYAGFFQSEPDFDSRLKNRLSRSFVRF